MRRNKTVVHLIVAVFILTTTSCGGGAGDTAPPPTSTYTGAPVDYRGDGVLLVVTWADWASFWPLTRAAVEEYRATQPAAVDFQYVNADEQPGLVRALGSDVVPSVVIVRDGRVVGAEGNVTDPEQIRRLVAQHGAER